MRYADTRLIGTLFHGWWELFTLFVMLAAAVALIGWAWNRRLRPADRGPLVHAAMLISAYALLLIVRQLHAPLWTAIIITSGVIIGGWLGRSGGPRGLWVPVLLIGALFGLGFSLSAAICTLASVLVLLFSPGQR